MKTQIVYLEPHDDLNSVRDKLNWTQASRVILVWPGRGRVLTRRFDLVMLQRFASNKGTQIALVTLDPDVLLQAEDLHIPTFESLEPQPEKAWRVRGERKATKPVSSKENSSLNPAHRPDRDSTPMSRAPRIAAFSLGLLAILVLVILLVPKAEILVQPEAKDVNETTTVPLEFGGANGIATPARLTARKIRAEIEGQMRATTTGTTAQADQPAYGEVTFTNLTTQSLAIPTGTTVRTFDANAPYFLTQSRVNLDAEEGAQVTVEVLAAQPGPEGNVPADSIQAIDGILGLSASVSNAAPTIGGSLEYRRAVSPADQSQLRQELQEDLFAEAHQALLGMTQEGEDIIPGSIHITKILEERFSNDVGDAADSLELSLIYEFEGIVFSPDELNFVLEQILAQNLSPGENIQPESLDIYNIADIVYDPDIENTEIVVSVSATVFDELDPSVLSTIVRGKPIDEAVKDLENERSIEAVLGVDISPSWIRIFPLLDLQIHIRNPWDADA